MSRKQITYISILNGVAILAVVMGHMVNIALSSSPYKSFASDIAAWGHVQMPLFFCISGFLYFLTAKNKGWKDLMTSKFYRLYVPFLFFSFAMWGVKLCMPADAMKHTVEFSWNYVYKIFFDPWHGPQPHLWFVLTLLMMFALTPLYKWSLKKKSWSALMFTCLILINLTNITGGGRENDFLCLYNVKNYLIYFYSGMLICKYDFVNKYSNNSIITVTSGVVYFFMIYYYNFCDFIMYSSGIVFFFLLAVIIGKHIPDFFSTFRNTSYQIYLMHMTPVLVAQFLYRTQMIDNDFIWFVLVYVGGTLLGIYAPVVITKIVNKIPSSYIRMCIGLK